MAEAKSGRRPQAKEKVATKSTAVPKTAVKEKAAPSGQRPQAKEKAVPKPVAAAKPAQAAVKDKPSKMANATYATGKRKSSVARVYLALGKGDVAVNGRKMADYFKRKVLQLIVEQPFVVGGVLGRYDVRAGVVGGGLSGQAGAVRHGISKALILADPVLRPMLKKAGFLTRDSRVVERKHFGHHKARRSTQFSKR